MVSYDTSDDRGNESLGVYRSASDAKTEALKEVHLWQDNFACKILSF